MGRRRDAVCAWGLVALGVLAAVGFASVSAASAASPCANAPSSGAHSFTLVSGGKRRSALVHVPRGIGAHRRVPLVLVLHGAGGSGPKMEHYSGFSHVADLHGFVAAYPSSVGPVWNSAAVTGEVDDVAFLRELVSRVQQMICVDTHRVFGAGVSNGGGMIALLGCRFSELDAIAPVEGDYAGQPRCRPAHPLSILEIHGTADQVAPYFGPGGRASTNGLPSFVNAWVRIDGCSQQPVTSGVATRTSLYRFGGCAGQVSVQHIRIEGGQHQWPGALPPDPGPPSTICAACTIWSFFDAVPTGNSGTGGAGIS
jgi:polyhydroxybutyrate depolymerase